MAHGHEVSRLEIRLSRDDRRWLTEFAKDADLSVEVLAIHAIRHFRNWEVTGRKGLEEVLACIDDVLRDHEKRLRTQRLYYERLIRAERISAARRRAQRGAAAPRVRGNALYSQKVAKLLALAVSSDSDGEATVALARARALHRQTALS